VVKAVEQVGRRRFGLAEFNGRIYPARVHPGQFVHVVNVDPVDNLVAAGLGNFFNGLAHFAVAEQKNIHGRVRKRVVNG
jgi:hypothetical protein